METGLLSGAVLEQGASMRGQHSRGVDAMALAATTLPDQPVVAL